MKKIFTFLVAFLATVSGAVWGQDGSAQNPYVIDLNTSTPGDIGEGDYLGDPAPVTFQDNAFRITKNGYYKIVGTTLTYRIDVGSRSSVAVRQHPTDVTIILEDASITVADNPAIWIYDPGKNGDEPTVKIQLVGENRLTTNSGSWAAISVNANANLDIIAESTGSLYVTGAVGIGNADEPDSGLFGDEQQGAVGNIAIYGGTVVAIGNGQYPGIGGRAYDETDVTINGNTFVVTNNGEGNAIQNFEKGIFYDTSEGDNTASVYGAVVLNSEYPSSEGILENELKFDITDRATLTLGSGISFPTTRLANANDESKLKAYKVTYDLNKSVGENEDIQITNEADYVAIYAGANVDLAALPEDSRTDVPSWQAMAWGQNKGGTYAKVTKTGSTTPSTAVTNNQINATAIWAVDTWTDINVTQNETLDETIQLFYPQEAASLFTISNGTDLNQYGAALGTGDNANKVVAHTTGAIASPNEQATNVELTISGDNKKITLPFKVNKYAPSLKDATITVKKDGREYNSEPIKEVSEIISKIMVGGSEVAFTNVEMQFKKDNEGLEGDDLSSAPEEVGKYWVSVKAKAGATSYQGESKYVQFEITPKTVTVKSVADEVYTINGDGTFDWSDNVTMEG